MDAAFVKPLYTAGGPWSSVYLSTARDETLAAHEIELRWRELRDALAEQGSPEGDLAAIDEVVGSDRGLPGPHGQAVFAHDGQVALVREVPAPVVASRAVFDRLPDVMPLLARASDIGSRLLVYVDREGAELEVLDEAGPQASGEVQGRDRPITKVQSGYWEHDRRQRRAERTWQDNAREVAEQVERTAQELDAGMIALCGDVRARSLVLDELGPVWAPRTAVVPGSGADGADRDAVRQEAERAAAEFEYAERTEMVDRYARALAAGKAVQGLADTVDALRAGRVGTLLMRTEDAEAEAPVWWGQDAGQLSIEPTELQATHPPNVSRSRAADALVRAATLTDAKLLLFAKHEPGPRGFVGAQLRSG